MAQSGRTSGAPWTDYGRPLGGAEEAVAAVVEQLLVDGGTMLWQKYLERKAFGYASDAVVNSIVSNVKMCYVAHDAGEMEDDDGWEIEDEPEAGTIDCWARMHLPVRRLSAGDGAPPGTGASRQARSTAGLNRSQQGLRSRNADTRQRNVRAGKSDKAESRSTPIHDEVAIDEEEEQLREAKFQEHARKREKEKRAREVEKTKEEERKQVAVRHEEMKNRPHTFDQEGNIIWVEDLKVERLPRVQEAAGYTVKKDAKARSMEETMRSTAASSKQDAPDPGPSAKRRTGRNQTKGSNGRPAKAPAEPEFTDGFSKLQHGQPPVLETMVVQTGVTLEALGKKKAGAPDLGIDRQVMSRHMGKKFEAMGHLAFQRAPRYHVPQLGGPQGYGAAQPPLGATMGHGLVRHGSLKEDYFFPTPMPELPMGLLRSTSDVSVGMGSGRRAALAIGSARGGLPGGGTPKGSGTPKGHGGGHGVKSGLPKELSRDSPGVGGGVVDGPSEEQVGGHGRMHPETASPAYRNFRHQLLPEPPTATVGGSTFGSGGGFGSRY